MPSLKSQLGGPVSFTSQNRHDKCEVASGPEVNATYRASCSEWEVWKSTGHPMSDDNTFPFDYADNFEEHVLMTKGRATLTPNDGGTPFDVQAGEYVVFHQGFACTWKVHEPTEKFFQYFDKNGNKCAPTGVACDACGGDCFVASW